MHFFEEALFEMAPKMHMEMEAQLAAIIRASSSDVPPFFQFGSWIGGDRDGNPG